METIDRRTRGGPYGSIIASLPVTRRGFVRHLIPRVDRTSAANFNNWPQWREISRIDGYFRPRQARDVMLR